jgi:hypothetical protein
MTTIADDVLAEAEEQARDRDGVQERIALALERIAAALERSERS